MSNRERDDDYDRYWDRDLSEAQSPHGSRASSRQRGRPELVDLSDYARLAFEYLMPVGGPPPMVDVPQALRKELALERLFLACRCPPSALRRDLVAGIVDYLAAAGATITLDQKTWTPSAIRGQQDELLRALGLIRDQEGHEAIERAFLSACMDHTTHTLRAHVQQLLRESEPLRDAPTSPFMPRGRSDPDEPYGTSRR